MDHETQKKLAGKKRIVAVVSLAVVVCVTIFLTYSLAVKFRAIAPSGVEFREFIQGYGAYGIFVAVGLQILQVFVALIPGEVVEVGLGYAYGWLGGSLLCLFGVAVGSSIIFLLVKRFGIRLIELFVSVNRINELKFINSEKKLRRFTFILFFVPGTPKDLITYFLGLTRLTLSEFLSLTLFARIPSVITSTLGGDLIGDGHYFEAVITFVITGIIGIAGMKYYDSLMARIKKRTERIRTSLPLKKFKAGKMSANEQMEKGESDNG